MNTLVKRKIHYIDAALQNWLVFTFLLLEVLLIGGGMIVMYLELKDVVEENLFRIHLAASERLSSLLFWKTMHILSALVVLNVVALGLAEWLWEHHLKSILHPLSNLLRRTAELDFTPDETLGAHHAVLLNTIAWRERERQRCMDMRTAICDLDENIDYSSAGALEKTRAALEVLRALLPEDRR